MLSASLAVSTIYKSYPHPSTILTKPIPQPIDKKHFLVLVEIEVYLNTQEMVLFHYHYFSPKFYQIINRHPIKESTIINLILEHLFQYSQYKCHEKHLFKLALIFYLHSFIENFPHPKVSISNR